MTSPVSSTTSSPILQGISGVEGPPRRPPRSRQATDSSDTSLLGNSIAVDHDELASNRLELDQSGHQFFEMMTHDGREQTGDIGHDGMLDEEAQLERERRRRAKGKAKVSNATSHDRDLDDEESSSDRLNFPPETGDEDAREAKRIADNLAAWSRAETTRRKTVRKNAPQLIVLPSAPPLPTASDLAQRSSALIRAGSKKITRASKPHFGSEEIPHIPGDSAKTRHQWTSDLPLHERNSSRDAPPTSIQESALGQATPTMEYTTNPFASRPSSVIRAASTDTPSGGPVSSSRFIEDLPLQSPGVSPTRTALNPFASTAAPLDSPTRSSSINVNPFSDGFEAADRSRQSRPGEEVSAGSGQRPRTDTLDSQYTVRAGSRERPVIDNNGASVYGRRQRSSAEYENYIDHRRDEYQTAGSSSWRRSRGGEMSDSEDDEDDDDEVNDDGPVGWLGWVFCGCFGDADRHGDEQTGKTNPMA